jgi:hypothetical protein
MVRGRHLILKRTRRKFKPINATALCHVIYIQVFGLICIFQYKLRFFFAFRLCDVLYTSTLGIRLLSTLPQFLVRFFMSGHFLPEQCYNASMLQSVLVMCQ